ncbi:MULTISPECIES: GNAT family N-acetyltransferase [Aeromicrobium]|nr:GNAT family N-acetyltransferase [Aeromicrobium sp. 636]
MALEFEAGGLDRADVRALLAEHLSDMFATSPAESVHALDLDALGEGAVSFWTAREDGRLLGCGALKDLGGGHGELKSMRTTADARGRGVATALLAHLVATARSQGWTRLSLETGTEPYFAAARRLYAREGFEACEPFGDYALDPHSVFLTRAI